MIINYVTLQEPTLFDTNVFVIELKVLMSAGVSLNVLRYLSIHASKVKILSEHIP